MGFGVKRNIGLQPPCRRLRVGVAKLAAQRRQPCGKYAHQANVERFERELASETNPERRELLERLLEEERVQLKRVLDERAPH